MSRITIDVKAGSREEGVKEIGDNHYIVSVKAPRRKGKANASVVKILKKHFGRPVFIVSGHTSTRKIVEIEE
jgi:uncharacterized protein (TIGR00251 family)